MSIDWSKAPEGANKAGFTGHEYLQFYRIPGMFGDYDYWNERMGTWCGSDFPTCANHLFDRPEKVEWNGQGLPPVGTVCEYKYTHWPEYHQCEIRYISAASLIVYDHGQEQYYRTCDMLFRPLLTPEQIAAEERSKECDRIFVILSSVEREGNRSDMAEALYDAGYRRQEEGK